MMGTLNAYRTHVNQHFVTVIGEVPAMAVMQLAKSVELVKTVSAE